MYAKKKKHKKPESGCFLPGFCKIWPFAKSAISLTETCVFRCVYCGLKSGGSEIGGAAFFTFFFPFWKTRQCILKMICMHAVDIFTRWFRLSHLVDLLRSPSKRISLCLHLNKLLTLVFCAAAILFWKSSLPFIIFCLCFVIRCSFLWTCCCLWD